MKKFHKQINSKKREESLFSMPLYLYIDLTRELYVTSLYDDIIRSIASAAETKRLRAVVNACVLSLTPPSGTSLSITPVAANARR
jgi:adenine/guanine phosphoribosyltransferase-like PRPP-binding protein